jgi:hypothetical protein
MARVGFSPTPMEGGEERCRTSAPCGCPSVPCETSVGCNGSTAADVDRSFPPRYAKTCHDRPRCPAAAALHDRRSERSRRALVPAARDLARGQDRGRSRREGAQDRAAGRRSGTARAAASAARRKRALPVSEHVEALARPRSRGRCRPRGARQAARDGRCGAVRGARIGAKLARAGQGATPIEIAAFPVEMDAAARPVSEFTILALGGLLHMVGEPERKPLRLGGHQASYAAGLTAFTGLTAALAARDAGHTAPAVRVSLAEVMQWVNWKAASGRGSVGHLARPRGQERRNSRSCPARMAMSPSSTPRRSGRRRAT